MELFGDNDIIVILLRFHQPSLRCPFERIQIDKTNKIMNKKLTIHRGTISIHIKLINIKIKIRKNSQLIQSIETLSHQNIEMC